VGGQRAGALAARLRRRIHVIERIDEIAAVARAVAR
jgi:hypothetical protein